MPLPALRRFAIFVVAAILTLAEPDAGVVAQTDREAGSESETAPEAERPGRSGLPLPRFVSLRASVVNLRTGPGVRYPIDWVYHRPDLPVEIIDEFEAWRRIRDWQGTVGWVHQSMLQGRRTLLLVGERRVLRRGPEADAAGLALLEPGVIAQLLSCDGNWCRVEVRGFEGWLDRGEVYGLYPEERID